MIRIIDYKSIPRTGLSGENTLIIFDLDEKTKKAVTESCQTQNVTLYVANNMTDLIAIPAYLVIIEPARIKERHLKEYYNWLEMMKDINCHTLFIHRPFVTPPKSLSNSISILPGKKKEEFLKFFVMKRKAAYTRRQGEARKYNRKIFRLMYIIKELRDSYIVSTKELCEEFNVTTRTIQRDIELLQSLGIFVEYDKKCGAYCRVEDVFD